MRITFKDHYLGAYLGGGNEIHTEIEFSEKKPEVCKALHRMGNLLLDELTNEIRGRNAYKVNGSKLSLKYYATTASASVLLSNIAYKLKNSKIISEQAYKAIVAINTEHFSKKDTPWVAGVGYRYGTFVLIIQDDGVKSELDVHDIRDPENRKCNKLNYDKKYDSISSEEKSTTTTTTTKENSKQSRGSLFATKFSLISPSSTSSDSISETPSLT